MNNRYKLFEKLGEGSFGIVFRAFDKVEGRVVAIKFLKDKSLEGIAQFKREALLLYQQLDNRFIIDLLDHDLDSAEPYMVLEYCDQGSLRKLVGSLSWQAVASILAEVVEGLQKIHEGGGFHRDLKPENLLLKTEGTDIVVKVADFGLARMPGVGSRMTHGPGGTPGYIAREVIEGEPFSAVADIYSLGIIATELLTGELKSSLDKTDAPQAFRTLIFAMRNSTAEQRPPIRQIARVLHALLASLVPPVPPTPPSASASAPPSSAPFVVGGLVLAAALVALAALADGDKHWDKNVRRYRRSNGQLA